ncbi:tyrosine-protein phosphatase 99A-like isoform X5 [Ruditapes philippinarum]|uniref:tyrosine-protein phosphatase 99A-like isoform X5 n=1 Tax=Ruditapes philippinarum TaxID=129788 RepID=UPI00295C1E7B|nr:tyrosine-protein phosphatase 99A-like isoform X5 [Ruditapes philippinarum]
MTIWEHGLIFIALLCTAGCASLVFPRSPGVVYSPLNQTASIPCELNFPLDEELELFMWYKETVYILYKDKNGQIKHREPSDENKFTISGDNSSLIISRVQSEDGGNFTCRKSFKKQVNGALEFFEEAKSTELIVQDVPTPPGMPTVSSIESREAIVSWEKSLKDNNSPILNYIINVKKISDEDWTKSRALLVDKNTTNIIVRGLIPNQGYQIRVIAKNALGNSEPSSESQIFMTYPAAVKYPQRRRKMVKRDLLNTTTKPEEAPKNLVAISPNSTKILLRWTPLPEDARNGEDGGYDVEYKQVGIEEKLAFVIEDPNRKEVLIENLKPFTNYSVSVNFFNDVGKGPVATTFVKTIEGVPEKPRITHLSEMKSTSFVVNWEAPVIENGILKNYQLQWIHNNTFKTRIITGHLTQPMSAHITGLRPYTEYQLRVRAETGGGYSDYSDFYPALTDVDKPSAPFILNVSVVSSTAIYVQWLPPTTFYKKIDSYFIRYIATSGDQWRDDQMVSGSDHKEGSLCVKRTTLIKDLPTNTEYKLVIAAVTQSIFSMSYYIGDFSQEIIFQLEDPTVVTEAVQEETVNAGMIAGIVVGLIFISIIVLFFVGYRSMTCRKYTRSLYYLAVPTNSQSPQSTVVFPPDPIEEDTKYHEIRVIDFLQHNRSMHANSDDGFSVEFEEISSRTRTDLMADASYLPENKAKNRYVNISAFDHTRVILQTLPGRPKSDYINANFIDGYNKPHAYIATQGPLPHTFADYWRMIWEQGSIVIIMITNLIERGRRKCDMYWPEEGSETYGYVTVKHINTFSRAHYTVRMFSLKSSKNKKKHVSERIVYQYHYTEWPDHGVPEFTLPVLKFIQKSSGENPPGAGPIVIHCSAGVGRTGTYILIESMIKQIKDKGTVNIPAFLLHIRQQRNFLVQTEEQYMLIHDAIAEYILTQGDTEIRADDISKYLSQVTNQINGEMTSLDIQYNLVTNFSPKPDDMFHALKSVNLCKNRKLDMVPLSVKRVILPMKPGVEGSDYINATYLQGYNKSNEFIVTQHPLEQTVEDFWRMVWDQNSSVIVQLSDVDDDDFKTFWPEKDNPIDIGCFKVTYREDDDDKKYKVREFLLQSNQDDYILMTTIVKPVNPWPSSCNPRHHVFDMVEEVQRLHRQNNIGPVIVVDSFGGVEATTFCAMFSIYDQLQFDKSVNIYQLAKLYHLKRAGCIGSKEDYLFLYQAAESLTKEMVERDKQSSPGSIRLHLGSAKKNGTLPRSVTINSKVETDV